MKLSTRKILILEAITLACVLTVTFGVQAGVLREYLQIVVLVLAILAGVVLLGWARPHNQNVKNIAIIILLAAVLFQAATFVLLGIKQGFLANIYGWNLSSIGKVFLPAILLIIAEETFRGQMLEKGKTSRAAIIITTAVIWAIEVCIALPAYSLDNPRNIFDIIMVVSFPALLKNIMLTFLALGYDYRIGLGYRLIMELPVIVLPIWPDVSNYLTAIFQTTLVVVILIVLIISHHGYTLSMAVSNSRKKISQAETERQRQCKKVTKIALWTIVVVIMVVYVALMSGIFKFYFLAVGSGSMEPTLYRGDMILVEKTEDYDKIQEGEVLVYQHGEIIVVHRVQEKRAHGDQYTFVTKGDANAEADSWVIPQKDVIGTVKGKITAFGFPTLWFNELFNGEKI